VSEIVFDRPAERWGEALPIGNGMLGAMVFGRTTTERIQVNEDSLWCGGRRERVNPAALARLDDVRALLRQGRGADAEEEAASSLYATPPEQARYQTLGDVWVGLAPSDAPEPERYRRSLDLDRAVGTTSYVLDGHQVTCEWFSSAPAHVTVLHVSSDAPMALTVSLSRDGAPCDVSSLDGAGLALTGVAAEEGEQDGMAFALATRLVTEAGVARAQGGRIEAEGVREASVLITGRTAFRSADPIAWCRSTLDDAACVPYARLLSDHVADHRALFSACSLELDGTDDAVSGETTATRLSRLREGKADPDLLRTYFDYGRYLLVSSSREGSLPANLQGIWNEDLDPAWNSRFTLNINEEMNYWVAEATGLGSLQLPLLDLLCRMDERGRDVAESMYGARGACCHHNTDIWADCAPVDRWMPATIWPMGGVWLCLHLLSHLEYAHDEALSRRYYPVLRDFVLFTIDYLVRDSSGHWTTGPSTSPENSYVGPDGHATSLCMGPTMDQELLRDLYEGFLAVSEELGVDDDVVRGASMRLVGLRPLQVGSHGQVMEWVEDLEEVEPGHRHLSPLFALFPADQVRYGRDDELVEASRVTLDRRLANGGGATGWSRAWVACCQARLHDAEAAYEATCGLLAGSAMDDLLNADNLLVDDPVFQIDGNLGGARAILEMLVQDQGDLLRILPALPSELASGRLSGVRTRRGCVLDMAWEAGSLTRLSVTATREASFSLELPGVEAKEVRLPVGSALAFDGATV
jgi:alpha-L-fucosidase 2